jgi:predicted MFS family arabinose efflux permease
VPRELRGRMMALYLMVFMGGTPFGSPLIGWIGEAFGARWSLIAGGGLSILGTLLCVAVFLHLRAKREAPVAAPGADRLLRLPG